MHYLRVECVVVEPGESPDARPLLRYRDELSIWFQVNPVAVRGYTFTRLDTMDSYPSLEDQRSVLRVVESLAQASPVDPVAWMADLLTRAGIEHRDNRQYGDSVLRIASTRTETWLSVATVLGV